MIEHLLLFKEEYCPKGGEVVMNRELHNRLDLKIRRKGLRKSLNRAEAILWNCLKKGQLGKKFRRQHSIGPFIIDFYCPACKFGIELDGGTHDNEQSQTHDSIRTEFLKTKGIKIIRFLNEEVYNNLEGVLNLIKNHLN